MNIGLLSGHLTRLSFPDLNFTIYDDSAPNQVSFEVPRYVVRNVLFLLRPSLSILRVPKVADGRQFGMEENLQAIQGLTDHLQQLRTALNGTPTRIGTYLQKVWYRQGLPRRGTR